MDVFRRLKPYVWPYRMTLFWAIVSMGLLTAFGLLRPYVMRWLIDDVIRGGKEAWLWPLALSFIAIALIRGVFNYLRQYLGEWAGQKITFRLRQSLYDKLQSLSFTYYDRARTGDLMSRLTMDVDAFRMFFSFGLVFLMDFFFMVGFGLIAMLLISPRLTLVTFVLMPFLAVAAVRFDRRIREAYGAIRQSLSELTTVIQENLTGIRTVKSFSREPHEMERFREKNEDFARKNVVATDLLARYIPLMEGIGNLSATLLLWYGGSMVIRGDLSLGSLVAFFSLIGYLIWPLRELGFLLNMVEQAQAAGARLLEVLETPPAVQSQPHPYRPKEVRGEVEFRGVTFHYPDGSPVLRDIHLHVPAGQVVAILGTTGAGKSSLVSLIPRFYDVSQGEVRVDGVDVRRWDLAVLRRHIGFVPGETFLFSASIRENIAYGRPEASMEEIRQAARRAMAHEFIEGLPQGYDTLVGERGMGLSGGQKQRVAIARALLYDPRILILDDATSSVDMETEWHIQKALEEVMKGRTTFIIAHRVASLRRAHQIIVLDEGRIVERGTHEELLEKGGLYARIYWTQLGQTADEDLQKGAAGAR
ncbi:MAG: ABC transporter ATP-binding protein/permease [Clostridiales bacterium]|nr:ABC transporter ATP-binding protein/permease [Clostridiales bacterium]